MNKAPDFIKGDKVVILRGEHKGIRGIINDIQGNDADIEFLDGSVTLPITALQNFSSAARKAWRTRPDRAAGRPKVPNLPPKRMVSLRLDVSVWDSLGKAVEMDIIRSRESAVNQWLREKLDEIWSQSDIVEKKDD